MIAFSQTDIKRLVAYTSISHMGFVMIGIYAGTEAALIGVVVQMIAHGLVGRRAVHPVRARSTNACRRAICANMGGLWTRLPNLPPILLFFALASLGLPGLGNFVGEFLILSGTFVVAPWVAIVASSGSDLRRGVRADHGPARAARTDAGRRRRTRRCTFVDLTKRELAMMFDADCAAVGRRSAIRSR